MTPPYLVLNVTKNTLVLQGLIFKISSNLDKARPNLDFEIRIAERDILF